MIVPSVIRAGTGEQFAAFTFNLFGGWLLPRKDVDEKSGDGHNSNANRGDDPRRTERERQMNWNQREHSLLAERIVDTRRFGSKGYC